MKKLLFSLTKKDFTIQTFRCGGAGGQNVNKRDTGVRIIHNESGLRAESRVHRTQLENKHEAFRKLARSAEMQAWLKLEAARMTGALERSVDAAMDPRNIQVEYYDPDLVSPSEKSPG